MTSLAVTLANKQMDLAVVGARASIRCVCVCECGIYIPYRGVGRHPLAWKQPLLLSLLFSPLCGPDGIPVGAICPWEEVGHDVGNCKVKAAPEEASSLSRHSTPLLHA